jgi:hypothetical protein
MSEESGGWNVDPVDKKPVTPYSPTGPAGYAKLFNYNNHGINDVSGMKDAQALKDAGLLRYTPGSSSGDGSTEGTWNVDWNKAPVLGGGKTLENKDYGYGQLNPALSRYLIRTVDDPNYGKIGVYNNQLINADKKKGDLGFTRQGLATVASVGMAPLAAAYAPTLAAGMGAGGSSIAEGIIGAGIRAAPSLIANGGKIDARSLAMNLAGGIAGGMMPTMPSYLSDLYKYGRMGYGMYNTIRNPSIGGGLASARQLSDIYGKFGG